MMPRPPTVTAPKARIMLQRLPLLSLVIGLTVTRAVRMLGGGADVFDEASFTLRYRP